MPHRGPPQLPWEIKKEGGRTWQVEQAAALQACSCPSRSAPEAKQCTFLLQPRQGAL